MLPKRLNLLIETVIALFEFYCGDDAFNAHVQETIFFGMDCRQFRFHPPDILLKVMLLGDRLNDLYHSIHDSLLVMDHLTEYFGHDFI